MPNGKPAGVRCIQLDDRNRCMIFGQPERPAVCRNLKPEAAMCGRSAAEAMRTIAAWEIASAPF